MAKEGVPKKTHGDLLSDVCYDLTVKKRNLPLCQKIRQTFKNNTDPSISHKIDTLCSEAQKCIWKIQDIERNLTSLEAKQYSTYQYHNPSSKDIGTTEMVQSNKKYYQNIQTVKLSKTQYIQHLQRILQFLQELNSQILALRYSQSAPKMEDSIMETIDDLLIKMKALEEIQ